MIFMVVFLIVSVVWIACGVIAYGMTLFDFERDFPFFGGHLGIARTMGGFGPVGLLVAILCSHKYGLMFKPYTKEEKWHFYHARFPPMSYESFEEHYD